MKLSDQQKNVLDIITRQTIKQSGANKGKRKAYISADHLDGRTVRSLHARGLLIYKTETVFGSGYSAIESS